MEPNIFTQEELANFHVIDSSIHIGWLSIPSSARRSAIARIVSVTTECLINRYDRLVGRTVSRASFYDAIGKTRSRVSRTIYTRKPQQNPASTPQTPKTASD